MHRVRTWARAKAHGPAPLTSDRRSSTARTPTQPLPLSEPATGANKIPAAVDPTGAIPPPQPTEDNAPAAGESEKTSDAVEKPNVTVRFFRVVKDILFSSWINLLLVFVPVGIAVKFANLSAGIVFAMNAIAIIPLAGLLSHATESVASRLGDTIGALMNVTFGNAVELIIFIALVKNEIRIVQASLLGSILANLLLILGMCFLLGGLRFREQIYNSTVTQMSACLLSLSVTSLLLPTAFHASFSDLATADVKVLQVSRGVSVVLLLVYALYLLFQLNSHAYMYESTPQEVIERESQPGPAAQYFVSSSSSDTSSSSTDSDESTHSRSTRKRIKRAMKGMKSKKSSTTTKPEDDVIEGEVAEEAVPMTFEPIAKSSSAPLDMSRVNPMMDPDAMVERAMEDGDEGGPRRDKHRKRKAKRHHASDGEPSSEPAAAGEGGAVQPAAAATGDAAKRVDFALAPEVEAQTDAQPKPFPMRFMHRPTMPKRISQNVFAAPPERSRDAATMSDRPSNMRRVQSMPADNRVYRAAPGEVPPIVPILITTKRKTQKAEGSSDDDDEPPNISRTSAIVLLLVSTGLVALCAEFMVGSINDVVSSGSGLSEAFIGLILLPIVGNAAEHVTGVTVALKNKMDLAIGVAVGSSIQIALFVTPLVVILGWIMNKPMSLFFTIFETVSMFVSAFIVNFLVLDGRSNYLEGALLCAAYVIIGTASFFYPDAEEASDIGGGSNDTAVEGAKMMLRSMTRLAELW